MKVPVSSAEYIRRFHSSNPHPAATTRHFKSSTVVTPTKTSVATAEPLPCASLSDLLAIHHRDALQGMKPPVDPTKIGIDHYSAVDAINSSERFQMYGCRETINDDIIRAFRKVSLDETTVSGVHKQNLAVTRPRSVSEDLSLTRRATNNQFGGLSRTSNSFPENSPFPRRLYHGGENQALSSQQGRPILGARNDPSRVNDFAFSRQNFDASNVSRQMFDENEPFRPISLPVNQPARKAFGALENLTNNGRPLVPKTEITPTLSAINSFKTAAVSDNSNYKWSTAEDFKENWFSAANSGASLQDTDIFSSYDRFLLDEENKNRFTAVMSADYSSASDEVFSISAEKSADSLEDSCDRCMRELMGMGSGPLPQVSKPVMAFDSDSGRSYSQVNIIEIIVFYISLFKDYM